MLSLSELLNTPAFATEARRYLDERWQRDAVIPYLRSLGPYTFHLWPVEVWRRRLADRIVARVWQCRKCDCYFGVKAPKPGHFIYFHQDCPDCREPLIQAIQTTFYFTKA